MKTKDMKSTYPNNSIVYLGQLEWAEAIDLASELGMKVPNALMMFDILKLPQLRYFNAKTALTSTTGYMNTREFVIPTDKTEFKEVQLLGENTCDKKMKRHAFAITDDFDMYSNYNYYEYPK